MHTFLFASSSKLLKRCKKAEQVICNELQIHRLCVERKVSYCVGRDRFI